MPNKWSSQQRAKMAGHVAFEMAARRAALANYRAKKDAFAAEAFLLHARVLAEFFWTKKKKYPDDCRAAILWTKRSGGRSVPS